MKYAILVLFLGSNAFAFPGVTTAVLKSDCSSIHNSSEFGDFQNLLQKVSVLCQKDSRGRISCKDPRGPLAEIGSKMAMKADEMATSAASTLSVNCEGGVPGAGVLYGNCGQLATNVHVLRTATGLAKKCHIENHGEPHFEQDVEINAQTSHMMTKDWEKERNLDIALIRLKPTIPGMKCPQLDPSGDLMFAGTEMVMVSPSQLRMKQKVNGPVAVGCHVQNLLVPDGAPNSQIFTDCAATDETSGSMILSRNSEGALTLKALHEGSTHEEGDGKPFKHGVNESMEVGLDLDVVNKMIKFQAEGMNQAALEEAPATSKNVDN